MPMETAAAICSMMFSGLFSKLPNLRVCFAHGGGSFPGTIGRIEHGFYCRPDLVAVDCKVPPREWMGHFWLDSLVHDSVALQSVTDLVGAGRVVLGTDYPFPLGEINIGALIAGMSDETEHTHQGEKPSPLSAEQRAKWTEERKQRMLWNNALEFLGIEHQEERYLIDWTRKSKEKKQITAGDASSSSSSSSSVTDSLANLSITSPPPAAASAAAPAQLK
jgi:predicted TIM-barrel fold metal-dependent hydrolase